MSGIRRIVLAAPIATLLAASAAMAQTTFYATLTNSQENPPTNPTLQNGQPRPASFGTAVFNLNAAQDAMTFTATIFNIDVTGTQTADTNDNLGNAHIHAGPNNPPTNNPVVWGFFGTPFNDNNPDDHVVTPFTGGLVGGTFSGKWDPGEGNGTATLSNQLANIFAGRAYINFHTAQFTGGEIRGQILAPEPSMLGVAALGGLLLKRSRRT
jgi:hypothetical protein